MPKVMPKYKQLEEQKRKLMKERCESEAHIRRLETSLRLWRERLRKAEGEYGTIDKRYWKIVVAMKKRAER